MGNLSPAKAASLCVKSWFSSISSHIRLTNFAVAVLIAAALSAPAQAKVTTTIALAVSSSSGPVTTVPFGTAVTLTATVTPASGTIGAGQVNFCDASAKYCTDVHVLATAQITSAGTATFKFRPGLGNHSYKALFAGTNANAGSSSGPMSLAVTGTTGPFASTSTIAETGSWGAYHLTATVTEAGGTAPPTGTVSFIDTSNSGKVLTTSTLGASVAGVSWPNPQALTTETAGQGIAIGDFNGDGIPDLAATAGDSSRALKIWLRNASGTYTAAPSPAVPSSAFGPLIVADFNGDGKQDLALLNDYSGGAIIILLGNGDGTFTTVASSPSTQSGSNHFVAADFNGDGIPDIAVTSSSSKSLQILLGNGDGTFAATATTPVVAGYPTSIAVADLNGDGKLDVTVSDYNDDEVSVLLGNGDGTFATATSFHGASNGSPIALADFNGDGKLDLAQGVAGASGSSDSVAILFGNGDGTFAAPTSSQIGSISSTVLPTLQVVDFNADGIPDLVVPNSATGIISVFVGDGSGSFTSTPVPLVPFVYYGYVLASGDLNGDGRTDLVFSNTYTNNVSVNLTAPTETATATASLSMATAGQHLVDATYSGDTNYHASTSGTLPLWGIPPATTSLLTVTAGGSPVTTVTPGTVVTLTASVKSGASSLTSGKVNFCDAAASQCADIHWLGTAQLTSNGTAIYKFVPGAGLHSYKAVFVQSGLGISSSSSAVGLSVGPAKAPVYTATNSLAVSGSSGNYSLTATLQGFGGSAPPTGSISFLDTSFGNGVLGTAPLSSGTAGTGWLMSQTSALGGYPASEVTGDFNGDGIPDVAFIWTPNTYTIGVPYSVTIFFGSASGAFTAGPTTAVAAVQSTPVMIASDFNRDGKTDLAILAASLSDNANYVTVLTGNGDGTFAAPQTSQAYNQGPIGGDVVTGSMVAADFNGDGKMDLAVVGGLVASGEVTILLGNGSGTFTSMGTSYGANASFSQIATGDFNGDGIPDLIASSYFSPGGATILLGKGDGTFTAVTGSPAVGTFGTSIVVGDFNGDSKLDVAFGAGGGADVYLGNGDGTFVHASANPGLSGGTSLVAGDFNHDGKLDLAGIDSYNNVIDISIGAGDGTFTATPTSPGLGQNTPIGIAVADFNGDGVPDLVLTSRLVNTASILLTEPTQTVSATINGVAPIGAGTHNVEASFPGDSHYAASVSSPVALTAGLAPLVISPAAGTYTSVQSVTITESVPGATIYYFASGSIDTNNAYIPYTGPIPLRHGGMAYITAYATETGYQQSDYLTANYALVLPATATPVISPAAGYYAGPQTVTITDSDSSAKIYYTTNGTYPTTSSTLYSGPITVSASETLVVTALSDAHSYSQFVSAQYFIGTSSVPLIYSVAGSGGYGYSGDGGPATLAQTSNIYGVVKDSSGNLYFSDESNHMVRKVAAGTGIISVVAGNGYGGYAGDGGLAVNAELIYPTVLVLDNAGNLFIADNGNYTVREVNLASGVISTYAGNPNGITPGDGGPATAANLYYIGGMAFDSSHNLYIAGTSTGTIRQVNNSTGILTTVAGTGLYGFAGEGGPASNAEFRGAYGLAFDSSGSLYIADSGNDLVRKIIATNGVISSSSIITTIAGTVPQGFLTWGGYSGDGGPATSAQLDNPVAVTLDNSGNLFISDEYSGAIREVTASNGIISTVAGNGLLCGSIGGDGGVATGSSLCDPLGVAVDSAGDIYIADQFHRIREVVIAPAPPSSQAAAPTFSVAAGTYSDPQTITISDTTPGASIYVTVDGSTPITSYSYGYSMPLSVTGTLTIKAVASAPGFLTSPPASATYHVSAFAPSITTVAGTGTAGFSGAGGPALNATFAAPSGIAFDKAGNMFVSDAPNNVVWMISASTRAASIYAGTGTRGRTGDGGTAITATLSYPRGLAFDSVGNLYIADTDNDVIRKVTASTGIISTVAGGGGTIGDGGPATSAVLSSPAAIAFDGTGNLYIADTQDRRVRKVSATTGIITTVAGNGSSTYKGDGGPATSTGLQPVQWIAVDKAANIFIGTDARIFKVTASSGLINTIAGLKDLSGNTGDGGQATSAEVSPTALTLDPAGNLYVSNWPGEVREINSATGVITKVAGFGFPGYSGDGGAAAVAQLTSPAQVAFDAAGNLYIADAYNYRIRKVTLAAPTAATPAFSVPAGTYTTPQSVALTDATPNATIYYTTDGSAPSLSSNPYTTPITVSSSVTIKAIAIASGYNQSAVASAAYVITMLPPTPSVTSLSPQLTSAGSAQFTLTVNGSGFTSASSVYWGTSALTTQFVSATQLTATVPASDLTAAGVVAVMVQTPSASSASNTLQFEIDSAGSGAPPSFPTPSVTVTAGETATYLVTLPTSATNVSVRCLNLPTGATCSYSATTGMLTVTTAASTPTGTYIITAAFTETLPGAAAAVLLLPFLLAPFADKKRRNTTQLRLLAIVAAIGVFAIAVGCGGGGGGVVPPPPPATHQVTSSATITLIVK